MRVSVLGIVSYKVFPAKMGGQKCVENWYRHLAAKVPVTLAVAKENMITPGSAYTALPFLYDHWWGWLNLIYIFRFRRIIKEKKITVIVMESSYLAWLGWLLRKITKKPFVIRSHNIEFQRLQDLNNSFWPLYQWYEKKMHQAADHSFFICEEDRNWAMQHWGLPENTCSVLTYGNDITAPADEAEKAACKDFLVSKYAIPAGTRLFIFNGTLNYLPNKDALRILLRELMPILVSSGFSFRIIICGSHLSESWQRELAKYPSIIYAGFVEDIETYVKGVDCLINPVTLGRGIKTKLVDAIACNQSVISTRSGARGIPLQLVGDKMQLVEDYDWPAFASAMIGFNNAEKRSTPDIFYRAFNADHLVQKALVSLPSHE